MKLGECVGPYGTVSVLLHYKTRFTIPERYGLNYDDIVEDYVNVV